MDASAIDLTSLHLVPSQRAEDLEEAGILLCISLEVRAGTGDN